MVIKEFKKRVEDLEKEEENKEETKEKNELQEKERLLNKAEEFINNGGTVAGEKKGKKKQKSSWPPEGVTRFSLPVPNELLEKMDTLRKECLVPLNRTQWILKMLEMIVNE